MLFSPQPESRTPCLIKNSLFITDGKDAFSDSRPRRKRVWHNYCNIICQESGYEANNVIVGVELESVVDELSEPNVNGEANIAGLPGARRH